MARSEIHAEKLLLGFPRALREAGLAADPARTTSFLRACKSMPTHSLSVLSRLGRITLTGSPDEFPVYDRVFKSWFAGAEGFVADPEGEGETVREKPKPRDGLAFEILPGDTSGRDASSDEVIGTKSFLAANAVDSALLARIRRDAVHFPTRRSRKWKAASLGPRLDLAETCAQARHTLGETLRLSWMARPEKARRILILIDISGSMQAHSQYCLRAALAISRARTGVETFCIGTRLTRVTENLCCRDPEVALNSLGQRVFDFDGGTRLGIGLSEFLSVANYAALVRGAIVIVISDGLERGDFTPMVKSVERLSRLGHRLIWLTPLANDPKFIPATRALAACLPFLDYLGNAGSLAALAMSLSKIGELELKPRGTAERIFQQQRGSA
ncbi:MAG: VWA domain-containing protein [Aestuariivirga sp.]